MKILHVIGGMDRGHYYRKRVHHQRISPDRKRQRCCDRCQLLGEVQDDLSDDDGHCVDPGTAIPECCVSLAR